jgi:hypothetical protein
MDVKEKLVKARINSFTLRPSCHQMVTYTLFILQTVIYYSCINIIIPNESDHIVCTIVYSLTMILTIITAILTSYLDPTAI